MKQANYSLRLISTVLTLLIFTFSASSVFADDDNYDVETYGEITALSDSSLEVNGLNFLVNGDTMIKDNHGDPIDFSDLSIGDVVEVKANVTDAGFTASKIKLEDEPEHNGQLETKGYIETLGDDYLIVNGITLYVDDQTEVKDGDNHISFGDLSEGDFVEVKAHYRDDGTFLSDEIKIEGEHGSGDDDFETEGYIESIGDSSLTVNGMLFIVDENTLIKDHDTIIPFENLSVGDYVEVHAVVFTDTSYLATKIELDDEGEHDGNFETEGFIESLGDSSLVVNGITFYVDENTVIKDHDNPIAFEDLNPGDFVEVKAQLQSDSTFLATEIEREGDHDNNFEIEGYIESKDSSSLIVSGITFFVDAQTEILDDQHNPITFDDLMVGMKVEVKAVLQADSTFLATRIKVEDENYQHIEITAAIDTIYDHTVVVAGIEFQTDSNTVILDENHDPITINDLEIGMIVEVYGILLDDGSYYATKIEVEDLWSNTVEFEGTLDAISDTMGQVGNWQFYIDAATVIISESGDTVDVSYLTVGMHVEVRATVQSDSSLLATRIKVDSPGDAAIIGIINGINGNSLVMGNLNIEINNVTFITDLANRQTDFSGLETGLVVKAKVTQSQSGSYVASRIKISENPNVVKSTGTVITVGPDFIVISQPSYQINAETIVLTSDYKPMDYSNIHPGDEVTVWADVSVTGDPLALQIKKSSDTVTNSDGGNLSVVKEYTLYQNYPNPFNPSTTIRFTLPQEAFVTLKVYNIVGEEVATLVNNNLTQGVHSVQFNASNLASGVYLYRLQVNAPGTGSGVGFVQVKKMLLLK